MKPALIRTWFFSFGLLLSLLTIDVQAYNGLSVGAARFEITPDLRLTNWITHKAYSEILEPIFVRAVVMAQNTERVALVSWELLYPMEGAVAKVRREIARETGIATSNILVTATHNHSAPWSPVLGDPLTKAEKKVLESFLNDPRYPAWAQQVIDLSAKAVKEADLARKPASLSIGRAYIGDVVFNRRPIKTDGSVHGLATPVDPYALPRGLRFAPTDPIATVFVARGLDQAPISALFHMACHPVSVYPSYSGISCDWPGTVSVALQRELGGEAIFFQGCAGDIVPAQRGVPARDSMARTITDRILAAAKVAHPLDLNDNFRVLSRTVQAPVTEAARQDTGRDHFSAEVQVITCGPMAIVALPGEPLIGLATAIRQASPFPHTIVLGYSNGYGTQYVGMPGDKARGGYEMGSRNLGTDACGQLLVDAAIELLNLNRD